MHEGHVTNMQLLCSVQHQRLPPVGQLELLEVGGYGGVVGNMSQ